MQCEALMGDGYLRCLTYGGGEGGDTRRQGRKKMERIMISIMLLCFTAEYYDKSITSRFFIFILQNSFFIPQNSGTTPPLFGRKGTFLLRVPIDVLLVQDYLMNSRLRLNLPIANAVFIGLTNKSEYVGSRYR